MTDEIGEEDRWPSVVGACSGRLLLLLLLLQMYMEGVQADMTFFISLPRLVRVAQVSKCVLKSESLPPGRHTVAMVYENLLWGCKCECCF